MENKSITLKNEYLKVEISSCGAEMTSIRVPAGREYLHQRNPETWNRQAPVLFPISGHLAADKIIVDGTEYAIRSHGFAMDRIFNAEEHDDNHAIFSLVSDSETRKQYPYDFVLKIGYRLVGKAIRITYTVANTGGGDMFFSIGSHEGYICEGGLCGYEIQFEDREEKPYYFEGHSYDLDGFGEDGSGSVLRLCDAMFEGDKTVVFEEVKSNRVTLKNKNAETFVSVDFEDFDNLFIWSRKGADFVCIEPWCGMAEENETAADISVKPFIRRLKPSECFEINHSISIG